MDANQPRHGARAPRRDLGQTVRDGTVAVAGDAEAREDRAPGLVRDRDEVAERIRSVGHNTPATMAEYTDIARLEEHPNDYPDAGTMIANLLADHEAVIRQLREDIDTTADKLHDLGTSDFLTGLMEKHEKMAWMLRAYLA